MRRIAQLPAGLARRCAAPRVCPLPRCGAGLQARALWQRARVGAVPLRRAFSEAAAGGLDDAAAAAARPAKAAPKGRSPLLPVAGFVIVGGAGAYAMSKDVQDLVDSGLKSIGNGFEDFNDWSREIFESMGERFVAKKPEPWLLDLATMKYPEQIPTLVMDLDKVVAYLDHDSRKGWKLIKRPFADRFFRELSQYYELVLFSDDVFPVAQDIAYKWNIPVTGVLHRDFCKKKRDHYIKDISKLGRNLERVLIIDHDPQSFQLQPLNGIAIKPFTGDPADSELADLLEFLKAAASAPGDIRQFMQKFGGGDEDVGRRYLLHKQEQDALVEKRRSVGKVFASTNPGSVRQGGFNSFGGMR